MVGTRPNLIKASAVLGALSRYRGLRCRLVHTGQHYDPRLSATFFAELGLPRPAVALGVGSDTHARQTARIMLGLDRALDAEQPDVVVVTGDVNSTLAGALVAAKRGIPVAHVEAGLRCGDRAMPEEINRVLTDHLADLLFAPSADAVRNLRREGIAPARIHLVGNVMIDTLRSQRRAAERSRILERLGVSRRGYAVLTLHRPTNVDSPARLRALLGAVDWIQRRLPVIFPAHPRTRRGLSQPLFRARLASLGNLTLLEPLGYHDFVKLLTHARLVLTDSGGVQEETTALGVPCLTIRATTERPITVTHGTNRVVGSDPRRIIAAARRVLDRSPGAAVRRPLPPYWDGRAATRLARILVRALRER